MAVAGHIPQPDGLVDVAPGVEGDRRRQHLETWNPVQAVHEIVVTGLEVLVHLLDGGGKQEKVTNPEQALVNGSPY